ncbi:MAG: CHAT domain-containing protein [Okeania sp. SIO3I5]|uniref:CHAT domain-containing protein n=1 Tax=Okeania sp. SIO3I5 TaxID=2607805 RepID=UPI0013BABDA3|nr:CHAT domain-containing protein [Okeania sp. SIO3I5]NEQ37239.1 CHAT domain-containing protein [Okeania sp. SIO3I5]
MTQEFHISITPLGEDEYFVRTEKVPAGGLLAEERVQWPVEQWLAQARHLFRDPLIDLLEGKSNSQVVIPDQVVARSGEVVTPNLVALGQEMYQQLFKDTLRDSWSCAQGIAHNRGEVLQLRLGTKDRRISSLPWEVLHVGDRPLATGTDIVFSRYQPNTCLPKSTRILTSEEPLKILMAIATPSDKDSLQLEKEYEALQEELQKNSGETQIHLDILRQPGREQLTQALEQGKYQVFHYAGHSTWGISGGEISLVSNITGLTESLSGKDLAGLLVNNGIQMAVFNSCRGAYNHIVHSTDEGVEINLAEAMVKRGIPGVLAMAERIPDEVSLILTRLFYRNLNQGYPIDLSLSRARQGLISAYGSHELYWALPVVYLHQDFGGYLIEQQNYSQNEIEEDLPMPIDEKIESFEYPEDSTRVQPDIELEQLENEEEYFTEPETDNLNQQVEESKEEVMTFQMTLQEILQEIEIGKQLENQDYEKPEDLITPTESSEESNQSIVATSNTEKKSQKFSWKKTLGYAISGMMLFFGTNLISVNRQLPTSAKLPKAPAPTLNYEYNRIRLVNQPINSIPEVQTLAIQQFNQNDIQAGKMVVETLLEQGELVKAAETITAVPEKLSNAPEINFLKGRLAWELFQDSNQNNLIDEAINYWEKAAAKKPENIQYQNALGFAYYTKGDIEKAYAAWLKVLHLSGEIVPEIEKARPVSYNDHRNLSVKNREVLNAHAGLGLVTLKYAKNLQKNPVQAFKYAGKVMREAGQEFHILQLQKNWLWSPRARQDWDLLLKLRERQPFKGNKNSEELA